MQPDPGGDPEAGSVPVTDSAATSPVNKSPLARFRKTAKKAAGFAVMAKGGTPATPLTWKEYVHNFMDDPRFSPSAGAFSVLINVLIALSAVSFVAETLPAVEHMPLWWYLETIFISIFSVELALRYWSYPLTTKDFFSDAMNFIDLLSILPFYILLFFGWAIVDTRILRIIRLVRIFKFGRYYEPLMLIVNTFAGSIFSLALCVFFMAVGIIFFATLLWFIERGMWNIELACYQRDLCTSPERGVWQDPRGCFVFVDSGCSPYQSIPAAFYWAITTMTTVGYGDTYPVTPLGRFVAGLAMVSGILCVALPTTILAVEFADKYQIMNEQKKMSEQARYASTLNSEEQEFFSDIKALGKLHRRLDVCVPRLAILVATLSVAKADERHSALSQLSEDGFDRQVQDAHEALSRLGNRAIFSIKEYRGRISHYVPEFSAGGSVAG